MNHRGIRTMESTRRIAFVSFVAVLSACTTAQTRIRRHQADFDSYPPAVQRKIRAGQVDVGFTREQVALALGRPDRRYARKYESSVREVWIYGVGSGAPRVGIGFGIGPAGIDAFNGGAATSVDVLDPIDADAEIDRDEHLRIVFRDGKVASVKTQLE